LAGGQARHAHWYVIQTPPTLAVNLPEKVEVVADGQGNPPEVLTGTLALVNVTDEVELV
jgi:hypothetical protein